MQGITTRILAFGVFILSGGVVQSQTVMPVKDNNKRHQIEREVAWSEWEGHTPKWFYWLIELTQKDDYRDKDRRNILKLIPLVMAVRQTKIKTDEEKEDVDTWARQELFKLADLEIDVAYELIKKDLNILRSYFQKSLQRAIAAQTYTEMIREIKNEQVRIEGRIYTLHTSDIPNVDRREEYFKEIKSYSDLIHLTQRIAQAFELINKP